MRRILVVVGLVALAAALWGGAVAGCRSSMDFYKDGVEQINQRQYNDAVESLTKAIDKDPQSDLAYLNRGDAYFALGEFEKAIGDYDKAIGIRQGNPWYYNRRGLAHYHSKHYQAALDDWRKAKDLEERRAAQGVKVRKSQQFNEMQDMREQLMPEAEKNAAMAAVEPPPTEPPPPTDLAAVPPTEPPPTEPPPTEPPPTEPPPTEPPPVEPPPTEPPPTEPPPVEPPPVEPPPTEPPPTEPPPTEPPTEPPPVEPPPTEPPPTEPPTEVAPVPVRPAVKPVANLSGTWEQDGLVKFRLIDDGRRVVGEIAEIEGYAYYDVTLAWRTESTLEGYAVFKEISTPCQFETSVKWTLEVASPDELKGKVEEPEWDIADCNEKGRFLGDHSFARTTK